MNILVMNCGSSSLKYQLIDGESEAVLAKGLCERIGIDGSLLTHKAQGKDKVVLSVDMKNHTDAIEAVLRQLTDQRTGVLKSLSEIDAVGHRIVHGGEKFSASVLLDESVLHEVEACSRLAPLHNPANLTGIRACQKLMPKVPMAGVFDTAFHQTMPKNAFLYGLDYDYYMKSGVRRYGFHGTSHKYVSERTAKLLGRPLEDLKLIICHLGNGASVCAVKNGKSVDTSMGYTPLEGLVMGTRSGDLDPAIVGFLAEKEGKSLAEMIEILNKESGVLGISGGFSSDFRDLAAASAKGNQKAELALEAFAYRAGKYIGAYAAVMDGVDAIVFTAGAGENNSEVRSLIFQYITFLGITIDPEKNNVRGEEVLLSTQDSSVDVWVVPTNEELAIAKETMALLV